MLSFFIIIIIFVVFIIIICVIILSIYQICTFSFTESMEIEKFIVAGSLKK